MSKNTRPGVKTTDGVVGAGPFRLEIRRLVVNREEVVVLASELLRVFKAVKKCARNVFRTGKHPNRGVLDQSIFEGIPRIGAFVWGTDKIIADGVRIGVIKARQVRQKLITLGLEIVGGTHAKV